MICATRSSCTSNNCLCKSTSMPTRVSFQSRTSQPRFVQHVSKEHLHHDDHHLHDSMIINNNSCVSYNFVIIVIVSTVPVWIRRLQLTSHIWAFEPKSKWSAGHFMVMGLWLKLGAIRNKRQPALFTHFVGGFQMGFYVQCSGLSVVSVSKFVILKRLNNVPHAIHNTYCIQRKQCMPYFLTIFRILT